MLRIFLTAFGGAILSIAALLLIFWLSKERLPLRNLVFLLTLLIGVVGFCCGLGWHDRKYTGLRVLGATISVVSGLTSVMVFTNFDLSTRIPLAIVTGAILATIGWFLVWVDPQAYSE